MPWRIAFTAKGGDDGTVHLTDEALGQRVREAIQASGMTQQAVAEAAGMGATALSKALAGKRRFSSLEFALLCDALHISPGHLLDTGEPPLDPAAESAARVRWMMEMD